MAERQARRRLKESAASLAAAQPDERSVHALRVSCRRSRVTLAEFADQFAPGPRREARRAFRAAGRRLGKLRDLDVSAALAGQFADEHPLAVEYARRWLRDAREEKRAAEAASTEALAELPARVNGLKSAYRNTSDCFRKHAAKRLLKRLKQASRQYKSWKRSERADDLHELRIRIKKMRYTLEVYSGLYGKPGKQLLTDLEAVQDSLGKWNDHQLLNNYVRKMQAAADPYECEALQSLSTRVSAQTVEILRDVESEMAIYFDKERIRSIKKLFDEPKLPCCEK